MKNLTALLLTLTLAFFSISGCEPIGKETSDSVPTPLPFIEEYLEGPLKLEIVAEPEYKPVYTVVKAEESEIYIWQELSRYSPSDQITAGIMGYFWKESFMRSDAVAGWNVRNYFYGQDTDICVEFTQKIDAGLFDRSTKEYFIEMVQIHYGGYGLGQWLDTAYLNDFYEFIRRHHGSIGDAKLQCKFIFYSMQKNEKLWNSLLECKTALQCGRRIGTLYDGCGQESAEAIASCADLYYKKFHKETL